MPVRTQEDPPGAPRHPGARGAPSTPSGPVRAALLTRDGIRIDAEHQPCSGLGDADPDMGLAVVLAHGFSGSLDRPAVRRITQLLARDAGVVSFSFRGHGASGGRSTVGDLEVLDVRAAVDWARALGYRRIATLGFSMGGAVVLRHAALHSGTVDAVVSVSAPGRWYYRGTPPMRRLHWAVLRPEGRLLARWLLGTRIHSQEWADEPIPPMVAAGMISPVPLLVVHGDADPYFPVAHARGIHAAAGEPRELWVESGLGHAENAVGEELVGRISGWVRGRIQGEIRALRLATDAGAPVPSSGKASETTRRPVEREDA